MASSGSSSGSSGEDGGAGGGASVVLLELLRHVLFRELIAALLLQEAGASGVDVALAGGGRLVLRSPHEDHERDARSDLSRTL